MVIVQVASPEGKVIAVAQKANSLAHTKWLCKYHIVFSPKYRRKAIYNEYRRDLAQIFRDLCRWKGVEIIEGHLMPDHVHMLVSIPPKISVSSFMGYLRGKSSLLMFDRHANLRHELGNRRFWAEGHCVSTVGLNEATAAKCIREQERADIALDGQQTKRYAGGHDCVSDTFRLTAMSGREHITAMREPPITEKLIPFMPKCCVKGSASKRAVTSAIRLQASIAFVLRRTTSTSLV